MGSSRAVGVNENIESYDSGGGKDRAILNLWEGGTDYDKVTVTTSEVLECYRGLHVDSCNMSGGVASALYRWIIRPAVGEGHRGVPLLDGTIVAFDDTTTNYMWRLNEAHIQLQDLVSRHIVTSASYRSCYNLLTSDIGVIGCMAVDCNNLGTGAHYDFMVVVAGAGANCFIDCIGINGKTGVRLHNTNDVAYVYNCTLDGYSADVVDLAADTILNSKNCIYDGTISKGAGAVHNITTCLIGNPTAAVYRDAVYSTIAYAGMEVDLSEWDSIVTAGGGFVVRFTPGLDSTVGKMRCVSLGGASVGYGIKDMPLTENNLEFGFILNINLLTMANGNLFTSTLLHSTFGVFFSFIMRITRVGADYFIIFGLYNDAGAISWSGNHQISKTNDNFLKFNIKKATTSTANNASCKGYLDDNILEIISGVDCFFMYAGIDKIYSGLFSSVPVGTTGNLDLDEFYVKETANDDYHLKYTDTAAMNNGTNLSADGVAPFDDDIDKHVIVGNWDIGADKHTCHAIVNGLDGRHPGFIFNGINAEDIAIVNGVE